MSRGNKAILNHVDQGLSLRMFEAKARLVEVLLRNPPKGPTGAERREAALVERYEAWLKERGRTARRQRIDLPDIASPMYTDIYVETMRELIEAKGSAARTRVRTGLGQILDYERYVEHQSRALLLPSRPSGDLVDLLVRHDVACIWETEAGDFERVDPPAKR